jgi:hypothetical protein
MFHFPGFPPPALYIQAGVTPHHGCRVPPFGHPRINARLTAPRGLSRPPTSFIGSWYQGIHHAPSHTYTPDTPHPRHHPTPHPTGHRRETMRRGDPRPDKHQGTTTETKTINILILDARIHYPVLKHPTSTPHPPDTKPHPPPAPTPPHRAIREPRDGPAVCPRARTRNRRNTPPLHPTHRGPGPR